MQNFARTCRSTIRPASWRRAQGAGLRHGTACLGDLSKVEISKDASMKSAAAAMPDGAETSRADAGEPAAAEAECEIRGASAMMNTLAWSSAEVGEGF